MSNKRIHLEAPPQMWADLEAEKKKTGTPVSEIIRRAVANHLAKTKTQKQK